MEDSMLNKKIVNVEKIVLVTLREERYNIMEVILLLGEVLRILSTRVVEEKIPVCHVVNCVKMYYSNSNLLN
jgi:hypothetical protein